MSTSSFDTLGECALLISFGKTISLPANNRVMSLARGLDRAAITGVVDVVPAYSSLLVRFDPALIDEDSLREKLLSLMEPVRGTDAPTGASHVVPVHYGGEAGADLEALAASAGLTVQEAVRLHTGRAYRVFFVGFMPGFPYLGTLHRRLAAPRLSAPRVRVPAGSVGIAGRQTGIYPFSSPGGWRLVGKTSLTLWDPTRSRPSAFEPGDTVQFVESAMQTVPALTAPSAPDVTNPILEVLDAAGMATIQDQGRLGLGAVGLSQGGAMDPGAAARANALVGNAPPSAALEITWSGPSLRALRTTTIALGGADLGCTVDGRHIPPGIAWLVRTSSTIRFAPSGANAVAARAYLAVAGGFDVPLVLGSRSTYLPASFGGYAGRQLQHGDILSAERANRHALALAGRHWPEKTPSRADGTVVLRFIRYLGAAGLDATAFRAWMATVWTVSAHSDRMGSRLMPLEGTSPVQGSGEAVSFGVVRGAVQVPPDGNPLILNADHQTTGGYPLAGVVIEADWPLVAQLSPGAVVRFQEVTIEEAREARSHAKAALERGVAALIGR